MNAQYQAFRSFSLSLAMMIFLIVCGVGNATHADVIEIDSFITSGFYDGGIHFPHHINYVVGYSYPPAPLGSPPEPPPEQRYSARSFVHWSHFVNARIRCAHESWNGNKMCVSLSCHLPMLTQTETTATVSLKSRV